MEEGSGGSGGMFDVGDKPDTLRIATARAVVKVSPKTIILIKEGKSPKGNIVTQRESLRRWEPSVLGIYCLIAILYQ